MPVPLLYPVPCSTINRTHRCTAESTVLQQSIQCVTLPSSPCLPHFTAHPCLRPCNTVHRDPQHALQALDCRLRDGPEFGSNFEVAVHSLVVNILLKVPVR